MNRAKLPDRSYISFRSDNPRDGYDWNNLLTSDPYDDERVKGYDDVLHRTLSDIFRERCPTKELLRAPEHYTDPNSIFKLILEREPALVEVLPRRKRLPLLWLAVSSCYQNSAELLVRSGADVNECCESESALFGDERTSILHLLLLRMYPSSWNERFIRLLVEHGADLTARDIREDTVLHKAVGNGRVQATKFLLEKGVDVNAVGFRGGTPLLEAANTREADELLPLLMKHGADFTLRDNDGNNVLHRLADAPVEHTNLAKVFIEKGVSLHDRACYAQYQPIHLAVLEENHELVKLFLDRGANVNARTIDGKCPLHIATMNNRHGEVLKTLLEHGAYVNLKSSKGYTALHNACTRVIDYCKIETLLSAGADVCVEDDDGKTPFSLMYKPLLSFDMILKMLAVKKAYCLQQPSIELTKDEGRIKARDQNMWLFYQDCVERAKSTRFIESCTLLDLLVKCPCRIAALMRNREFEKKFELCDLDVFSMYAQDIRQAFERAKRYYSSMLEWEDTISEAVYDILPHMVVRKIVRYTLYCEGCETRRIVGRAWGSGDAT